MNLTVQHLKTHQADYLFVDVREPHELIGPEGYIEGALLATLGPGLRHFLETADLQPTYVFICRSGVRSAQATALARQAGLSAYNMTGGMLAWNQQLPIPKA